MMQALPSPVLAIGLDFALSHSSPSGWLVAGLILTLSVLSWGVILIKLRQLAIARAANGEFLHVFRHSHHPLSIFQTGEQFDDSPLFHIYMPAAQDLAFHLVGVDTPDKTFQQRFAGAGRITPSQSSAIRRTMERAMNEACVKVESRLGLVALAVSAAPVLGLLGTIWGIMDSFSEVASAKGAIPVQAVAPGVAAALLTTLLGLLVVVPSLVGYNFLVTRIRAMTMRLENFVGEVGTVLDRYYVDHHAPDDELPSMGSIGPPSVVSHAAAVTTPMPHAGNNPSSL
jgi:biopolymer transport protein TolQ